ncbi:MAG: L-histidine N(alpha)-methyltransferase [Solirubrobacterales bacterium]
MSDARPAPGPRVISLLGEGDERTLGADVRDGLSRPLKEIPPKHFYDTAGAELFDRICELPEYYPTRAERSILVEQSGEIVAATQVAELVELGSGTAEKTMVLLAAGVDGGSLARYLPVDVTEQMVRDCAARCAGELPGLEVTGIVGDFVRHLGEVPPPADGQPRVVALLGGTIGNFRPAERRELLSSIAGLLRPETDFLLLGTDLVKDRARLVAAYDDSAGVTAQFNRNVLRVVNRELGADFDVEAFEHVALWDEDEEWIEMRLRATRPMGVRIEALEMEVDLEEGEEIRTEISAKFTPERLAADLAAAGLEEVRAFPDPDRLFTLSLSRLAS